MPTSPKKLIAISDIHGRYDALRSLPLERFLESGYKVLFMGDYVGYGKQCVEVIEYLLALKDRYKDKVIILYGNWEDMLMTALFSTERDERDTMIKIMYSRGFSNEFKRIKQNKDKAKKLQDCMLMSYIDEDYCFTHAGINSGIVDLPKVKLEDIVKVSSKEDILWSMDFLEDDAEEIWRNDLRFVVGHVPVTKLNSDGKAKPFVNGVAIGIDFGASSVKGCLGYIRFDENGNRSYNAVPSIQR